MNTSRALINLPKQICSRYTTIQNVAVRSMADWVPQEKETHTGQVFSFKKICQLYVYVIFFRNGRQMTIDWQDLLTDQNKLIQILQ